MRTVFGYPGGKTYLADWIIEHFPDHDCYVEPFGGAAAVLVNKPRSKAEVYNDRDGDVVQFFRVLRERTDELVEWCRSRPYAKDLHEKYAHQFYAGYRPDDPVERAGRFFYLRHSQFAGKYTGYSGFSSGQAGNISRKYFNGVSELETFAERFRHVQIENRDYRAVFDRFDAPGVLWYCDPPYVEEGDELYSGEGFDHAEFCENLNDLDGYWCVSYTDVPAPLREYNIVEKRAGQHMRKGQPDMDRQERVERLVMNYDPNKKAPMTEQNQTGLTAFTDGGQ